MSSSITGLGITSAVGQGTEPVWEALREQRHAFGVLKREGRRSATSFLGAEIAALRLPDELQPQLLRRSSLTAKVLLTTVAEAWEDASLANVASDRIGLVIGGSNVQQREMVTLFDACRGREAFVPPSYGMTFMDSDLVGLCTEQFGIRGTSITAGAASASGQLAVLLADRAVTTGELDVCIAVGALTDVSHWECQAWRALGAMGSDRFADDPSKACRPFDRGRDGFIYGEGCAALVLESAASARRRGVRTYATVAGGASLMDANRNPDPSWESEAQVITMALARARVEHDQVRYLNLHGTGSPAGDDAEAKAVRASGLSHAYVNATKSILGHTLSAAGAVELAITALQMRRGWLHGTRNLEDPIDPTLRWVEDRGIEADVPYAVSLSLGMGGINTAICLARA